MAEPPRGEGEAYALLEQLRWGGPPPECPHCGVTGRCYFLRPAGGRARATRTGAESERRIWKCGSCRRQFSVLAATILQGTRISLWTWIGVVRERQATGALPSAPQVVERYGLTRAAARQLLRRLDLGLACEPAHSACRR
jgi:hypothetical protein